MNDLIIFYDGDCGLCNEVVHFVLDRDERQQFSFASLQSDYALNRLKGAALKNDPKALETFVLYDHGVYYEKSNAALRMLYRLGGAYLLLYLFQVLPAFFRDFFYDLVASNRKRLFPKGDNCRMPSASERERFLDYSA